MFRTFCILTFPDPVPVLAEISGSSRFLPIFLAKTSDNEVQSPYIFSFHFLHKKRFCLISGLDRNVRWFTDYSVLIWTKFLSQTSLKHIEMGQWRAIVLFHLLNFLKILFIDFCFVFRRKFCTKILSRLRKMRTAREFNALHHWIFCPKSSRQNADHKI